MSERPVSPPPSRPSISSESRPAMPGIALASNPGSPAWRRVGLDDQQAGQAAVQAERLDRRRRR